MTTKRVTISNETGNQKMITISPDTTWQQFLDLAGKKLEMNAVKVFSSGGAEVDDLEVVRDDDNLIITSKSALKRPNPTGPSLLKLAVIGGGGVGKSAITLKFVQNRFLVEYDPTIEDAYQKHVVVDGKQFLLDILDTAGQEDYVALRGQWMQERDGFIFVYSVTERKTFEDLEAFYNQLKQVHENPPPIVLLGNKCDIAEEQKKVKKLEGEELAKTYGNAQFFESSAKTGQNVEKAFSSLVREISKRRKPERTRSPCVIL